MSRSMVGLYHHLPVSLRPLAASLHGYYLRRWRYGPETERLVDEALERERWSPVRWKAWEEERLAYILHRAATRVPYYREHWLGRRRRGDRASWEVLQNWPIVTKEEVRKAPRAFVADDRSTRWMFEEHTSGTTGTPLTLWSTRDAVRAWYALFEARWRRWCNVSRRDRWATIGGRRVVPFEQDRPPFWVWNAGLNQLYMSAIHARPDFLRYYLDALRQYSVVYVYGYASTLYWLALNALDGDQMLDLKVTITNAEPLYDYQRAAISRAFRCDVRETYGLAEMVCGMSECEYGRMHLWPEAGYLELVDDRGDPVPRGQAGRVICTGLLNDGMPLVRYEVMDMAQLPAADMSCPCGRGLPVVQRVLGRLDDVLLTRDGRRIPLLDIIFGPELRLREAQIIQESVDVVRVKVVPAEGWSRRDEEAIRSALRERMGNVVVLVERTTEIERTWAGKYRVMVSKVGSHLSGRSQSSAPDPVQVRPI